VNIINFNVFDLQIIKEKYIPNILKDDEARCEIFNIIIKYLINNININKNQFNLSVAEILINNKFLGTKVKI
jgi:hypothetical protein